jgi:hypothetical protein
MKHIGQKWAWKTRQIDWACEVMNRASSVIWWIDRHAPSCVSGLMYHLYWFIDDAASAWFARAYQGSWEEIADAWEHEDEDWLSPFQRLVADGRILPLYME